MDGVLSLTDYLDILLCIDNFSNFNLGDLVTPYLDPLAVELSVLALSLYFSMWERCKVEATTNDTAIPDASVIIPHTPTRGYMQECLRYGRVCKGQGLVMGWSVLMFSISIVLISLYDFYTHVTDGSHSQMDAIVYGSHLAIIITSICAIIISVMAMNSLRTVASKERHTKYARDKYMLVGTSIFLIFYKILCIIAGAFNDHYVILFESLFGIFHAILQIMFINWFAVHKRVACIKQSQDKPGRQGMEYLRWANAAHWLINTFTLKNAGTKYVMESTFGQSAWALLSSITQPLVILFYFHSLMFISELLGDIYTWDNDDTKGTTDDGLAIDCDRPEETAVSYM